MDLETRISNHDHAKTNLPDNSIRIAGFGNDRLLRIDFKIRGIAEIGNTHSGGSGGARACRGEDSYSRRASSFPNGNDCCAAVAGGALQIVHLAKTGTLVKQGDVVVEFDPSEQEYNLEQSKSQLEEAEQQIKKMKADQAVRVAQEQVTLLKAQYRRSGAPSSK